MRGKVNLTIEESVAAEARGLKLNMSRIAEEAIAQAVKIERNRRWRDENRLALETYAREIEAEGLALERYRLF